MGLGGSCVLGQAPGKPNRRGRAGRVGTRVLAFVYWSRSVRGDYVLQLSYYGGFKLGVNGANPVLRSSPLHHTQSNRATSRKPHLHARLASSTPQSRNIVCSIHLARAVRDAAQAPSCKTPHAELARNRSRCRQYQVLNKLS